jgi:hypothetical protein
MRAVLCLVFVVVVLFVGVVCGDFNSNFNVVLSDSDKNWFLGEFDGSTLQVQSNPVTTGLPFQRTFGSYGGSTLFWAYPNSDSTTIFGVTSFSNSTSIRSAPSYEVPFKFVCLDALNAGVLIGLAENGSAVSINLVKRTQEIFATLSIQAGFTPLCAMDTSRQMYYVRISETNIAQSWLAGTPVPTFVAEYKCDGAVAMFVIDTTNTLGFIRNTTTFDLLYYAQGNLNTYECLNLISSGATVDNYIASAFDGMHSVALLATDAVYIVDISRPSNQHLPFPGPYTPSDCSMIAYP